MLNPGSDNQNQRFVHNNPGKPVASNRLAGTLSPTEIRRIITDPGIRPQDCPAMISAGKHLMNNPQDLYFQEYFAQLLNRRLKEAGVVNDSFYANYPPRKALLTAEPGIWAGNMVLTGENLPLPLSKSSSGSTRKRSTRRIYPKWPWSPWRHTSTSGCDLRGMRIKTITVCRIQEVNHGPLLLRSEERNHPDPRVREEETGPIRRQRGHAMWPSQGEIRGSALIAAPLCSMKV
jgi:hypothetical protein